MSKEEQQQEDILLRLLEKNLLLKTKVLQLQKVG